MGSVYLNENISTLNPVPRHKDWSICPVLGEVTHIHSVITLSSLYTSLLWLLFHHCPHH